MTMEEINTIEWEEFCEEDWFEKRRKNKKLPRLIYRDTHGNMYYYLPKVR